MVEAKFPAGAALRTGRERKNFLSASLLALVFLFLGTIRRSIPKSEVVGLSAVTNMHIAHLALKKLQKSRVP
jgi:hypothetical protein